MANLNHISDPSKSLEELQKILSGREYSVYYDQKPNIIGQWLDKLKDWLANILDKILPKTGFWGEGASQWLAYTILLVFFLLVIFLVVYMISRMVHRSVLKHKPVSATELTLSYNSHLNKVDQYATEEEYDLALRHLFLALILLLDQEKLLEARVWKTNGEYYEELKNNDRKLAKTFYAIALKFEETMYGGKPITKTEFQLFQELVYTRIIKGEKDAGQTLIQDS